MIKKLFFKKRANFFWIFNFIALFITYGFELANNSISLDDELIDYHVNHACLEQGRYGLFLLNKFFNYDNYLPFFYLAVTLMFFVIGNYIITNVFMEASDNKFSEGAAVVFSIITISCPNFMYKFLFCNNIIQMGIVYFCIAIALKFIYEFIISETINKHTILWFCIGVFFAYFVTLNDEASLISIVIITIYAIILYSLNNKIDLKKLSLYMLKMFLVFITTLITWKILQIIVLKVFNITMSEYVNDYILYTKDNFKSQFIAMIKEAFSYCRTHYIFFIENIILFLGLIGLSFISFKKNKCIAPIILSFGLLMCSISMIILTGNVHLIARAKLYLGEFFGVCAASIYIVMKDRNIKEYNIGKYLSIIFIFFVFYYQAKNANEVSYFVYLRSTFDCQKVYQIAEELEKNSSDYKSKPVIFIGIPHVYDMPYYITGEYVDASLFRCNRENEEIYNCARIYSLFHYLGIELQWGTQELYERAIKDSANSPVFPKEGSVKEYNDYIVVKLGELNNIPQ